MHDFETITGALGRLGSARDAAAFEVLDAVALMTTSGAIDFDDLEHREPGDPGLCAMVAEVLADHFPADVAALPVGALGRWCPAVAVVVEDLRVSFVKWSGPGDRRESWPHQ